MEKKSKICYTQTHDLIRILHSLSRRRNAGNTRGASCRKLIDINGNVLHTPLSTNKIIAYQITGKRTLEENGIVKVIYILNQLTAQELTAYM